MYKVPTSKKLSLCPAMENEIFEWLKDKRLKGQREAILSYNRVLLEVIPVDLSQFLTEVVSASLLCISWLVGQFL